MRSINHGVYAITDFKSLCDKDVYAKTELILQAGVCLLQYRDKSAQVTHKVKRAQALQSLCKQFSTPLIINDDLKLARSIQADGVHLGKQDASILEARDYLGNVIIGRSCYNRLAAAREAQQQGADYVAMGAFYATKAKTNAVRAIPALLSLARTKINLPIVAIGGITPENGKVLLDSGADILAVISALYGASDTISAMEEFNKLFK